MESLFINFQMIFKSQFWKIDPYDWFVSRVTYVYDYMFVYDWQIYTTLVKTE